MLVLAEVPAAHAGTQGNRAVGTQVPVIALGKKEEVMISQDAGWLRRSGLVPGW